MKKYLFPSLLILAAAYYFYITRNSNMDADTLAPEIDTELVDGTPFKLSDLRGEYVLLDFWGSWCPPCRKENPHLVKLHEDFSDKTFKDANGFGRKPQKRMGSHGNTKLLTFHVWFYYLRWRRNTAFQMYPPNFSSVLMAR